MVSGDPPRGCRRSRLPSGARLTTVGSADGDRFPPGPLPARPAWIFLRCHGLPSPVTGAGRHGGRHPAHHVCAQPSGRPPEPRPLHRSGRSPLGLAERDAPDGVVPECGGQDQRYRYGHPFRHQLVFPGPTPELRRSARVVAGRHQMVHRHVRPGALHVRLELPCRPARHQLHRSLECIPKGLRGRTPARSGLRCSPIPPPGSTGSRHRNRDCRPAPCRGGWKRQS